MKNALLSGLLVGSIYGVYCCESSWRDHGILANVFEILGCGLAAAVLMVVVWLLGIRLWTTMLGGPRQP